VFWQEVTSVDTENKVVSLDGGKETLAYNQLILATGGTPRRLPIEGAQLENVFTFRGVEDAKKVDAGKCVPFVKRLKLLIYLSGNSCEGGKTSCCHRKLVH
jgi:NAD(P)H-nitrite reductase large subunit